MLPWASRLKLAVGSVVPKKYQRLVLPLVLSFFLWLLLVQSLYHSDYGGHRDTLSSSSSSSSLHTTLQDNNGKLVQRAFRKLAGVLNSTSAVLTIKISVFQDDAMTSKDVIVRSTGSDVMGGDVNNVIKTTMPPKILSSDSRSGQHVNMVKTTSVNSVTLRPFERQVNMAAFQPVLSPGEKAILLDLASILTRVTNALNTTCFMYGGSLLGSYRHHDLIPWDDDIDVIVKLRSKDKLFAALSRLGPAYGVFWAGPRLKFYSVDSVKTSKYPWKWPYVDVHFYRENATHIWDSAKEFRKYVYEKSYTFPLHPRPLGGIYMNSPRDSFATLKATYRNTTTMCETHFYSHKLETNKELKRYRVPCEALKDRLAFVHRSPGLDPERGGITETLVKGDNVVHSLVVEEPQYAISKPYSLELL